MATPIVVPGRRERRTWASMIRRCHGTPTTHHAPHYRDRGIVVCERWLQSFENFYADMGPCPEGLTLDRIDNDGPYSPDNCRWATWIEQNSNRRNTQFVTAFGESLTRSEWSRRSGILPQTIRQRLIRGWDPDRAVAAPLLPGGRGKHRK